jgi:hypothetical protein
MDEMLTGTLNNSPQLVQEWKGIGRNRNRRILREKYGALGDEMHRDGVGTLNIGPLSRAVIERFLIKLGKALYYLHTSEILDGVMYVVHISEQEAEMDDGPLDAALKFAPWLATPTRTKRSLADQFLYRWGRTAELGAFQAVVRFSSQLMFRIVAMRRDTAESVEGESLERVGKVPVFGRYDCRLPEPLS